MKYDLYMKYMYINAQEGVQRGSQSSFCKELRLNKSHFPFVVVIFLPDTFDVLLALMDRPYRSIFLLTCLDMQIISRLFKLLKNNKQTKIKKSHDKLSKMKNILSFSAKKENKSIRPVMYIF